MSQLKSMKPQVTLNCANCSKKSEENKLCFHCEKVHCLNCFDIHIAQLKNRSRAILEQLEEIKKEWENLVEVNIIEKKRLRERIRIYLIK